MSPGTNPQPAAIGNPEAATVEECAANCDAVLLSAWTACPATFVNVVLVAFSISTHFTSIHHLYERYERLTTNNPIITAAIFITFLMAYPATAPNRKPPPAENRMHSTDKQKICTPHSLKLCFSYSNMAPYFVSSNEPISNGGSYCFRSARARGDSIIDLKTFLMRLIYKNWHEKIS
jgi:hypothetical protein